MGITHLTGIEAVLVALSGIVIVFIMLAVLCFMIPIISKVVAAVSPKPAKAAAAPAAPASAAAPAAEKSASDGTWCGDIALIGCDEKTAAMVMAIVSHETGIPLNELIFKKIKAL